MAGPRVMLLLPSLALAACGNDVSGELAEPAYTDAAEIEREEGGVPAPNNHDRRDVGIARGLLCVAVFDALGRLVALYPVLDADRSNPDLTFREHVASDEAFELLAVGLGMNLGPRITFDRAYDPTRTHTFVAMSRYGTLAVRSLKVNSPAPSGERLMGSTELELAPDAPENGSFVSANPDCFVRGARWGTVAYEDASLTFQAVVEESGAFVTVPFTDPSSARMTVERDPYELTLVISDLAESCL